MGAERLRRRHGGGAGGGGGIPPNLLYAPYTDLASVLQQVPNVFTPALGGKVVTADTYTDLADSVFTVFV